MAYVPSLVCLHRSEAPVLLTLFGVRSWVRFACLVDQVSVVMEQAIRLFHLCGVPAEDIDFINCDGPVMHG